MGEPTAEVRSYTIRLELVDRPGELRRALDPIADNGGNLRSIFHDRGNVTPRGQIPVEVDLAATPEQFESIVTALQDTDVTVIRAGTQQYPDEITVLLVGHLIETDLSDTLSRIETSTGTSVRDVTLAVPEGSDGKSSARLRLATESGNAADVLETVREIARDKAIRIVEPLTGGARS